MYHFFTVTSNFRLKLSQLWFQRIDIYLRLGFLFPTAKSGLQVGDLGDHFSQQHQASQEREKLVSPPHSSQDPTAQGI